MPAPVRQARDQAASASQLPSGELSKYSSSISITHILPLPAASQPARPGFWSSRCLPCWLAAAQHRGYPAAAQRSAAHRSCSPARCRKWRAGLIGPSCFAPSRAACTPDRRGTATSDSGRTTAGIARTVEPVPSCHAGRNSPQQLAEDLLANFQGAGLAEDAAVDFGMASGPCRRDRAAGEEADVTTADRRGRALVRRAADDYHREGCSPIPAAARPPQRVQPARAGCAVTVGGCGGERVAELADGGGAVGPSVAVPV